MNKPYTAWIVSGKEYKLRLTTRQIVEVEARLGLNLLKIFMPSNGEEAGLPPLNVMLVIVHGALQRFHHGKGLDDVYDLFDDYVDDGGDQVTFMADVIMPLFESSGFIPRSVGGSPKAPKLEGVD